MGEGEETDLDPALRLAQARARAKAGVLRHAAFFAASGLFLAATDLSASPESVWFYKPLGAWGLVLVIHAARAWFGKGGAAEGGGE